MDPKEELKVGDIVVHLHPGCENCTCDNLGKVFKIMQIQPASPTMTVDCIQGKNFENKILAYDDEGAYYVIEWLAKYEHFKTWYNNLSA